MTHTNKLMNALEVQPKCACGRKEKVMFVCVNTDCPNNTKQPLYCILCSYLEPIAHKHNVMPISAQTSSLNNLWLELRNDVGKKVKIVKEWLATYKDLVQLLTVSTG